MIRALKNLLLLLTAFFCLSEIIVRVIISTPQVKTKYTQPLFEEHKLTGHWHRPNISTKAEIASNKMLIQTTYQTNEYGLRVVPIDKTFIRKKHLILMGASTVFGLGLNDNETQDYFFLENTKEFYPYNFSAIGFGPQSAYSFAESNFFKHTVNLPNGISLYFFQINRGTGNHINILLGSYGLKIRDWGEKITFYGDISSGSPKYLGSMRHFSPIKFYAYRFLQNFEIINFLYSYFYSPSDQELELAADFMRSLKIQLEKNLPLTEFNVVLHPLSDKALASAFASKLKSNQINVLDYSDLIPENEKESMLIPIGQFPHPNAKMNARIAKKLIQDLGLY